jgi:hypothetical protein
MSYSATSSLPPTKHRGACAESAALCTAHQLFESREGVSSSDELGKVGLPAVAAFACVVSVHRARHLPEAALAPTREYWVLVFAALNF